MKQNKLLFYTLIGLCAYVLTSCSNCDCDKTTATSSLKKKEVQNTTRGKGSTDMKAILANSFTEVERFSFEGDNLDGIESLNLDRDINAVDEDAAFLKNVLNTLLGAEKEATQLDVELMMSDEPVEDGMFVFSIKSSEEKDLSFQIYDEEGFDMVANNAFKITAGNNYKALKTSDFPNGTYVFKLEDDAGKELVRRIEIVDAK